MKQEIPAFFAGLFLGLLMGAIIISQYAAPELNKLRAENQTLLNLVEKKMKGN